MRAVTKGIKKEKNCTIWWGPLGIPSSSNLNILCSCFGEWDFWKQLYTNNLMNQICVLQVPDLRANIWVLAFAKNCFLLSWPISLRKKILPCIEWQHAMPSLIQMLFFMNEINNCSRKGSARASGRPERRFYAPVFFCLSLLLTWQVATRGRYSVSPSSLWVSLGKSEIMKHALYRCSTTRLVKHVNELLDSQNILSIAPIIEEHEA